MGADSVTIDTVHVDGALATAALFGPVTKWTVVGSFVLTNPSEGPVVNTSLHPAVDTTCVTLPAGTGLLSVKLSPFNELPVLGVALHETGLLPHDHPEAATFTHIFTVTNCRRFVGSKLHTLTFWLPPMLQLGFPEPIVTVAPELGLLLLAGSIAGLFGVVLMTVNWLGTKIETELMFEDEPAGEVFVTFTEKRCAFVPAATLVGDAEMEKFFAPPGAARLGTARIPTNTATASAAIHGTILARFWIDIYSPPQG